MQWHKIVLNVLYPISTSYTHFLSKFIKDFLAGLIYYFSCMLAAARDSCWAITEKKQYIFQTLNSVKWKSDSLEEEENPWRKYCVNCRVLYFPQLISVFFRLGRWYLSIKVQVSRSKLAENSEFLGLERIFWAKHVEKWLFCHFLANFGQKTYLLTINSQKF